MEKAYQKSPLTLDGDEIREVGTFIITLDAMLAAYVEQYGRALADTLTENLDNQIDEWMEAAGETPDKPTDTQEEE